MKSNKTYIGIIALVLYILSLITPTFAGEEMIGLWALLLGWLGLDDPFVALSWLANFGFFISLFIKKDKSAKFYIGLISLLMASMAFGIEEIQDFSLFRNRTIDAEPGNGFILWIFSFIVLNINNCIQKFDTKLNKI